MFTVAILSRDVAGGSERSVEHWRSVVLFGRNVASYKFALAKSLLELGQIGSDRVHLDELGEPFARHLCAHLKQVDRQGTFEHSRFLDACRFYNAGRINEEELRSATVMLGFNNVIDAFHVVRGGEIPTRFFVDERQTSTRGIRLTDALLELAASDHAGDLRGEAESRWRLVEESWDARADGKQITVLYDAPRESFIRGIFGKRRRVTEVRPALNGYQKGHCFYCFRPIHVAFPSDGAESHVDHFLPFSLMSRGIPHDLDQVWNLVLACSPCNLGPGGKMAILPAARYLARLYRRNEYLIESHHPLRETLMLQTGQSPNQRRAFLKAAVDAATELAGSHVGWAPRNEAPTLF